VEGILISVLVYPPLLGGRGRGLKNRMSKWAFQFSKCPRSISFVFSIVLIKYHEKKEPKRLEQV
jgi:hypothetical protein